MKTIAHRGLLAAALLAGTACGGSAQPEPNTVLGGAPTTDIQRLMPLEHNSVLSYDTLTEDGSQGVYVIEVSRPRSSMAELKVAGRVFRRYIAPEGVSVPGGGFVLKAPLKEGAEWQGEFGAVTVKTMSRTIDVPAGKFGGCVETVEAAETTAYSKQATSVFCPGVGLVFYRVEGESSGVSVSEQLSLRSFGPRYVAGVGQ